MTPVPLHLPVKPSEAVMLADLIVGHAADRPLTEDVRARLAGRAAALRLESIRPFFASLERDPVHPATFFLAVDAGNGAGLLLHIAVASAPAASGLYPKSLLIARMRSAAGREVAVNAAPFGICDRENVGKYAERVNPAFLPRPQGSQPAIIVAGGSPEVVMPAAFEAFRAILKRSGRNFAALAGDYHAAIWAAVRAGWREGFNLETELAQPSGAAAAAGYTRFRAHLPLEHALAIHEAVRRARRKSFDFELVLPADTATTPEELSAILEQTKDGGCAVQAVAVATHEPAALAAIARQFATALTLSTADAAPAGRVNLRLEFTPADTRERVIERIHAAARRLMGLT